MADDLRAGIASDRYPVGEALPPAGEIAERYGVAKIEALDERTKDL